MWEKLGIGRSYSVVIVFGLFTSVLGQSWLQEIRTELLLVDNSHVEEEDSRPGRINTYQRE